MTCLTCPKRQPLGLFDEIGTGIGNMIGGAMSIMLLGIGGLIVGYTVAKMTRPKV